MTLVAIVAIIGSMTLFLWIYKSYLAKSALLKEEIPKRGDEEKMKSISRKSLLTFASSQMVYVVSIITNQGRSIPIFIYSVIMPIYIFKRQKREAH